MSLCIHQSISGEKGYRIETDNYYDARGRLVATTSPAKGATEIAYDGAGRQTEVRTVTALEATEYSGVTFQYRDPQPGDVPGTEEAGEDDECIQLHRTVYDDAGNVTEQILMEAYHTDTDGMDLEHTELIQSAVYHWYDSVHRLDTTAVFGTGDTSWAYNGDLERPETKPTVSGTDGLVTIRTYNADGRLETVQHPKGTDYKTKFTYDDLGRTIRIEEAYDKAEVRCTLNQYDGLSNVTKRIADISNDDTFTDGAWTTDADDQITTYTFADTYNASLVTKIKYPDGDDTDDNVTFVYHLDGTLDKRQSQKISSNRVEITYDRNDTLRQLTAQKVTGTLDGEIDGSIQSIKNTYDSLGRIEKITSYLANDCTGTPVNEVLREFNDLGQLYRDYQEHDGAKDVSTLYVEYEYDTTESSSVYTKGMRLKGVIYPSGVEAFYGYGSDGISDKISRVETIGYGSSYPGYILARYDFNGAGRLVKIRYRADEAESSDQSGVLDYVGDSAYEGFDRFGRILEQRWYDPDDEEEVENREFYTYTYDYNSNPTFKRNEVTTDTDDLDRSQD